MRLIDGKLLTVEQSKKLSVSMRLRSRANKYGAKRCEIDGIKFDSLLEGRRWQELQLLRRAGKIGVVLVHQRHALYVEGKLIGHYESDFDYYDEQNNFHAEDCKGHITALAKWKIRHYEAQSGRKVEIITKVRKRA